MKMLRLQKNYRKLNKVFNLVVYAQWIVLAAQL